jgi:hypothetical protein
MRRQPPANASHPPRVQAVTQPALRRWSQVSVGAVAQRERECPASQWLPTCRRRWRCQWCHETWTPGARSRALKRQARCHCTLAPVAVTTSPLGNVQGDDAEQRRRRGRQQQREGRVCGHHRCFQGECGTHSRASSLAAVPLARCSRNSVRKAAHLCAPCKTPARRHP